jgi:hypothetical protein
VKSRVAAIRPGPGIHAIVDTAAPFEELNTKAWRAGLAGNDTLTKSTRKLLFAVYAQDGTS